MREPARNPAAALQRYTGVLQRSLSVVTKAIWISPRPDRSEGPYFLTTSEPVLRLPREGADPIYLRAAQLFTYERSARFAGEWRIRTLQYAYTLAVGPGEEDFVVAWHWHPDKRPECHLHAYHDHAELGSLARLHLPTQRVSFEEVLRFTIVDLHVRAAPNWERVLEDSENRFREYRTWHGPRREQ